jgi:hypothetical protein
MKRLDWSTLDAAARIDMAHRRHNLFAALLHIVFRTDGYCLDLLLRTDDMFQSRAKLSREMAVGH